MRKSFLMVVAAALACVPRSPPPLAIGNVTVIHPATGVVERNSTVIIDGDRIIASGPAVKSPAVFQVIDGTGKYLIPGLIDAHVHFFQSANLFTRPDAADFQKFMPYAREVARNKARLPATFKLWLASGVTGVADVGGPLWNFAVREAAKKMDAPRVVVAGPLVSFVDRPALALDDPPIIKVATVEESRALARRVLSHKPDFLKIWFVRQPNDDLPALEAMARAAGEEAHAAGVRLAVHATELDSAKAALRAGADLLVHSVADAPVDAEFLSLAKARKAIYTPTLFVGMGYGLALSGQWTPTAEESQRADPEVLMGLHLDKIPADIWPERVRQRAAAKAKVEPNPIALANLRAVRDAGIEICLGTDAGNIGTVHGPSIHRELALMAQGGMTPIEILRAATVGGADVLGMGDKLGDIAEGRLADLVLLDADPLADVGNLARVHLVVRGGKVFEPEALMASLGGER